MIFGVQMRGLLKMRRDTSDMLSRGLQVVSAFSTSNPEDSELEVSLGPLGGLGGFSSTTLELD
ncbi:hypothetical protein PM082_009946 [Marasmius tenuissimus]|nr:hypothetical protein PM082_009946 [Marasmius tenuissimus]